MAESPKPTKEDIAFMDAVGNLMRKKSDGLIQEKMKGAGMTPEVAEKMFKQPEIIALKKKAADALNAGGLPAYSDEMKSAVVAFAKREGLNDKQANALEWAYTIEQGMDVSIYFGRKKVLETEEGYKDLQNLKKEFSGVTEQFKKGSMEALEKVFKPVLAVPEALLKGLISGGADAGKGGMPTTPPGMTPADMPSTGAAPRR